jgi:hypothetical protein
MDDINVILADYPGVGHVRLCECTSIHLSVDPVTVCFSPEAFAQAAILIRNAMERLTEIVGDTKLDSDPLRPATKNHSRFTH